jgi:hypothetical protein
MVAPSGWTSATKKTLSMSGWRARRNSAMRLSGAEMKPGSKNGKLIR